MEFRPLLQGEILGWGWTSETHTTPWNSPESREAWWSWVGGVGGRNSWSEEEVWPLEPSLHRFPPGSQEGKGGRS